MRLHDVEQGSEEWYWLRAGTPTASNFAKLVTSTGQPSKQMPTYAALLAAERYAGKPLDGFDGNQWTERGKALEAQAIALYVFQRDAEVERVGLITDDAGQYGCSPDGLVGDAGLVEIKCLKTENHVKALIYYDKHRKVPPEYIPQTQGQLFVTERQWVDTMFHHPDLPPLVIRNEPIQAVHEGLATQIQAVIAERDRILAILQQEAA